MVRSRCFSTSRATVGICSALALARPRNASQRCARRRTSPKHLISGHPDFAPEGPDLLQRTPHLAWPDATPVFIVDAIILGRTRRERDNEAAVFIGHFGLGFGAKRVAPAVSLAVLFAACQWADLLWPTLVLAGVERVDVDPGNTVVTPLNFVAYPYSHSLEALVLWAVAAGVAYWLIRRSSLSAPLVIGGLVISHWVLDWITHRPDLPLTVSASHRVGLSLWNSVPGTVIVEGLIF